MAEQCISAVQAYRRTAGRQIDRARAYTLIYEALSDIMAELELNENEVSDTLIAYVAMLDQHNNATTTTANQGQVRGSTKAAAATAPGNASDNNNKVSLGEGSKRGRSVSSERRYLWVMREQLSGKPLCLAVRETSAWRCLSHRKSVLTGSNAPSTLNDKSQLRSYQMSHLD